MTAVQERLFGVRMTPEGEIRSDAETRREGAVYQELNEPVDVLALFEGGTLRPQRFRWRGRVHRVAQVTGTWKTDRGDHPVHHFALMDEGADFFQLAFDVRTNRWKVTRVWVE